MNTYSNKKYLQNLFVAEAGALCNVIHCQEIFTTVFTRDYNVTVAGGDVANSCTSGICSMCRSECEGH